MLPKINDSIKYDVKIPSTGKRVQFRPYRVKEEKQLLLAVESQDINLMLRTVVDTIEACVYDKLDIPSLTIFDVEYLLLKIRSKSVGEKSHLHVKCEHCKAPNEYVLNLDEIDIVVDSEKKKRIELTDTVSITLKWPSYVAIVEDAHVSNSTKMIDQIFNVLIQCIDSIQSEDENFLAKDTSREELVEFIESMNNSQYEKLSEFVNSIPKLKHTIDFKCAGCGEDNSIKLEGVYDFF